MTSLEPVPSAGPAAANPAATPRAEVSVLLVGPGQGGGAAGRRGRAQAGDRCRLECRVNTKARFLEITLYMDRKEPSAKEVGELERGGLWVGG